MVRGAGSGGGAGACTGGATTTGGEAGAGSGVSSGALARAGRLRALALIAGSLIGVLAYLLCWKVGGYQGALLGLAVLLVRVRQLPWSGSRDLPVRLERSGPASSRECGR